MAEQIISPGVFTTETDVSQIPAGIQNIGAAFVGPTLKGPVYSPTIVTSLAEYDRIFGAQANDYTRLAVKEYLNNASSATVMRVLGGGGWTFASGDLVALVDDATGEILTVFHPSKNESDLTLSESTLSPSTISATGSFALSLSGSNFTEKVVSASLVSTNANYIAKSLGTSADNSKAGANTYEDSAFAYLNFKDRQTALSGSTISLATSTAVNTFTSSFVEGYEFAATPWITSQLQSGVSTNLFKFHHLGAGFDTNKDVKVSIANVRDIDDIDGVEQYSKFDVYIRRYSDTDKRNEIVEQFRDCDLNPESANYIARRIGTRYYQYSATLGTVEGIGDYINNSRIVRVEVDPRVEEGAISPKLRPFGFRALSQTINFGGSYYLPSGSYKNDQTIDGSYSSKAYLGWDFTAKDNENYINPVPLNASADVAGDFNLDTLSGNANSGLWVGSLSASIDTTGVSGPAPSQLKFSVPFQGGSDGISYAVIRKTGEYLAASNSFGFDLTSTTSAGAVAYKKALDILSNTDEYDINMLITPGLIYNLGGGHAYIINQSIDMVETRGDAFYITDLVGVNNSVVEAANQAASLDTSYAATYYPWVKIADDVNGKPLFVPPSVVIPGAIAFNDRVGGEWFAPAGFSRGALGSVIETKIKLSKANRDTLYDNKVNAIASFPGSGVVVYGQKTLQTQASALDRINVRRLLINVKKFVASTSRFLVFEQNTTATRNRFLNLVNPYLEAIQQSQGLTAFKVVMDETNNTPDVIDRNQLVGQIYLQPTRTAEFIIVDFTVLPTGAAFPE